MRKRIKASLKILQDANEAVAFSIYKTTTTYEDEGPPTPITFKEVIKDPDSVPESITAMSKYCVRVHPNSKGGQIWAHVCMLHNEDINNIIADTMEDSKEDKARLSKQMIQH